VDQSKFRVWRNAPAASALPLTRGNVSGKALAAGRGQARLNDSDFRLTHYRGAGSDFVRRKWRWEVADDGVATQIAVRWGFPSVVPSHPPW